MKQTLFVVLSLFSSAIFAGPAPATLPTKNSEPIPTMQTTQNIDTVLSEKVQSVISKTPQLKNQAVSAASQDQIITLEGSVDNKTQETIAINAAKSVKGVKGVKSQLTIKLMNN